MNKNELLYEHIFCSEFGNQNRELLLRVHKDKLWEMYIEHQKSGVKIDGKAIDFDECIPQKLIE